MAFEEFLKRPLFTWQHYLHSFRKLLPKGFIWGFFSYDLGDILYDTISEEIILNDSIDAVDEIQDTIVGSEDYASSTFAKFLSVPASELERFEHRCYALVKEMVPGLSNEMLPEWWYMTVRGEYEVSLVDGDRDNMRELAHGKIFNEAQTATATWFEEYGATLGFGLTVDENPVSSSPFICGVSRCGERLGGRGSFSIIEINIDTEAAGSNKPLMKELFDKAKPAHVVIVWTEV